MLAPDIIAIIVYIGVTGEAIGGADLEVVDPGRQFMKEILFADIPAQAAGVEEAVLVTGFIAIVPAVVGRPLSEIPVLIAVGGLAGEVGQLGRKIVVEQGTFLIE